MRSDYVHWIIQPVWSLLFAVKGEWRIPKSSQGQKTWLYRYHQREEGKGNEKGKKKPKTLNTQAEDLCRNKSWVSIWNIKELKSKLKSGFLNLFTDNVNHCFFLFFFQSQSWDPSVLDCISTRHLGAKIKKIIKFNLAIYTFHLYKWRR